VVSHRSAGNAQQQGGAGALEDELRRAHRRALGEAYRCGLRGADAEDVASGAIVKALDAWDRFVPDGEGARERWITTIARNIVRDRARRFAFRHGIATDLWHAVQNDTSRAVRPDVVAINAEARRRREQLFASLAEEDRAAARFVMLVNAGELSRPDAAKALGLSVHNYDHMVQRVKRALRKVVMAQHIDVASLFDAPSEDDFT
jgi:RNA polymerase sigma factor (sigma-70 family)